MCFEIDITYGFRKRMLGELKLNTLLYNLRLPIVSLKALNDTINPHLTLLKNNLSNF